MLATCMASRRTGDRGGSHAPLPTLCPNGATTWVAPAASLQALVEPLVVQRSAHRSELLAEFLGGGGRDMGVVRGAVLPDFRNREVVRPVVLLPRLKSQGIRFLAGVLGELLEHHDALVLSGRDDVHVGDGIDRALAG